MKFKNLRKIAGLASVATIAFLTSFTPQMTSASHYSQAGVSCMPSSLSQAIGTIVGGNLSWDHMRVKNNAPVPLWVVCSVPNTLEERGDGSLIDIDGGVISVEAWYGSNAAANAEVLCILREVTGGGIGTTGDTALTTITAPGSLPGTKVGSITATGFTGGLPSITATCKLDPGTGIQGIRVLLT